jgi:hypothetical protein
MLNRSTLLSLTSIDLALGVPIYEAWRYLGG